MIGPSFERVAKMSLGMGRIHDIFFVKMLFLVTVLALFFGNTLKLNAVAEGTHSAFADVNISALLNSFQEGYDKRVRPNYGGIAVTVGVSLYVLSISRLSEVEMDFTLDMYFRQFWQDPRLSFESRQGLKKLVVGAEYINLIWVPDTFFVNEKTAYFHKATTENQFLRILHTGEILRSIRLTITASCPMDLQYFPMDRQLCYIEIESFGYTMSDIRYKWNDGLNSVQISADVSLPQFKVLGHRQKTIEASLSTGNYSRLACEIQFVRSMGYYLIQIYIPSSLIVIISWVSFWLNRGATPARVSLGVTTVLTMTTLMASTNAALPKISYVKSIDVYLGACFFMVFASLLEYASVGYMAKRIQMRKNRFLALQKMAEQKKNEAMNPGGPGLNDGGPPDHNGIPKQTEIRINMHDLNRSMPVGSSSSVRFSNNKGILVNSPRQAVHFKIRDPKMHCKGGSRESIVSRYHHESKYGMHRGMPPPVMRRYDEEAPPPPPQHYAQPPPLPQVPMPPPPAVPPAVPPNPECDMKELNKMFGMTASDIDKYSRVFFPVTFTCFQLMYWIIYQHLSDDVVEDLVYLHAD
ncbi:gamma-aminobutyric acid receptor subunit beta-like isoform X3 [Tigriopus californicus]|uniref:gamma-aminobutyric acid receptor subunit beta-like isoform X3 n=1 Tax=Tigriopus californicus TaxID=6832 RepID=UPI0027DA6262|nr:gamma-aminobutyric acid receptor subunit beta-like isoform X3 [Tigriopus californicus]